MAGLRPIPMGPLTGAGQRPAADIDGEDLDGRPLEIQVRSFDQALLLCFLHVHCDGCDSFWRGLADRPSLELPVSVSTVAVTKGPHAVDRHEVARAAGRNLDAEGEAGPDEVPVVMSDAAWADYRVTGYPFFVLVDARTQTVVGETVGFGWTDVYAMVQASGL
ncbi:MAG TPA: hypothetical protein VII46_06275 [Acidimicrobiales bacterium]